MATGPGVGREGLRGCELCRGHRDDGALGGAGCPRRRRVSGPPCVLWGPRECFHAHFSVSGKNTSVRTVRGGFPGVNRPIMPTLL